MRASSTPGMRICTVVPPDRQDPGEPAITAAVRRAYRASVDCANAMANRNLLQLNGTFAYCGEANLERSRGQVLATVRNRRRPRVDGTVRDHLPTVRLAGCW